MKRIALFLSIAAMLLSLFAATGCRKTDDVSQSSPPTAQAETGSPAETAGEAARAMAAASAQSTAPPATADPRSMVEELALQSLGLQAPFDYSRRRKAVDAGVVAVCGDEWTDNKHVMLQFIERYGSGEECGAVIAWYAGEELLDVHALLYRDGLLLCESINDAGRGTFVLLDLFNENGTVYGTLEDGCCLLLALNVLEEPRPVDLSEQIERLAGAQNAELHYFLVQPSSDSNGENRVAVKPGQFNALLEMLVAKPVYLLNDVMKQHASARPLDIRLTAERAGDRLTLTPQSDGSVLVGDGVALYVTDNGTLFEILLGMIGRKEFQPRDVGHVDSITVKYMDAGGVERELTVADADTVGRIAEALRAAGAGQCRIWFDPDVELTLHTGGGKVVCHLISGARPGEPADEIVVNGFFWCVSEEAVRLVRELLS